MIKFRKFYFIFILSVIVPLEAFGNVTSFSLENGMRVVVVEDHRAPVVTHMVWYRAGASDENSGKSGIAHLLEHLLFKETENVENGEFSKTVAALGGSDNAFTSQDYTAYYQRVSKQYLDLMMYYESDRMKNLKISELDFNTEVKVVIEERSQRTDSKPGALFNEQNMASLYLNHPYGVPIVGWRHELDDLVLEDAIDFYKTYYSPNNAILIVSGDVDPKNVQILANKFYGSLENTIYLDVRKRPAEPPQIVERRLIFEDERVSQPYITRTYLAAERDQGQQREAAALTLLADLIGSDGIQSILGKTLQLDNKKAIYTNAYYNGLSYDDTNFSLIVVPNNDVTLLDIEAELDKVINTFISKGIDEDHLERIKFQYKAQQIYSLDSAYSQARRFGVALTSGLTIEDVLAWPKIIQDIKSAEILAAAVSLFKKESSVTGWIRKPFEERE
ncbi:insulinase family protein [Paracoccaceae bacterium]|jgi:zinc protease|nr:insulinase family protein [Paracoccaceae bacterium]|tara:strand:+ start:751 stop:2091 length:1341 start_codon:yes stop_codon:yes gene_type:complete